MSNTIYSNKAHVRDDFKSCCTICCICKRTRKQKSKRFNSLYALKYHLTTEHNIEDEISAGITRKQVLQTIRAISHALDWNMLIDLPQRRDL